MEPRGPTASVVSQPGGLSSIRMGALLHGCVIQALTDRRYGQTVFIACPFSKRRIQKE